MASVSFEVPEYLVQAVGAEPETLSDAVRLAAAMHWYGRDLISMGTAAALADLTVGEFMHALKEAGQDTYTVDLEDLDRELAFLAERRRLSMERE
jgi:predicted HTH domain antitoxin